MDGDCATHAHLVGDDEALCTVRWGKTPTRGKTPRADIALATRILANIYLLIVSVLYVSRVCLLI